MRPERLGAEFGLLRDEFGWGELEEGGDGIYFLVIEADEARPGGSSCRSAGRGNAPRSSEDDAADDDRGDHAGDVGQQSGGHGVARAADGDRSEIDGQK